MTTQFTTNEYNVTENQLSNLVDSFDRHLEMETFNLWNIQLSPAGHGHYSIEATFNVNDKEVVIKTKTNNMQLVDAWRSGVDMYEGGEDGFDNWDEVVESMFYTISPEDNIAEILID